MRGTAAPQRRIANRRGDLWVGARADGDGRGPQPRERRGLPEAVDQNIEKFLKMRGYTDCESVRRGLQQMETIVDVMLVSDLKNAQIPATMKDGSTSVRYGENQKLRSYRPDKIGFDLKEDCGITFVAAVVSNSGVLGTHLQEYIAKLPHCVRRRRGIASARGWRRYWTQRLSYVATREAMRQFLRWEKAQTQPLGGGRPSSNSGTVGTVHMHVSTRRGVPGAHLREREVLCPSCFV